VSVDPTAIDIRFDPTVARMSGYTVHGNRYFNAPFISQIEGNLYQGGCENGLVLPAYIEHLVSLYRWEEYTIIGSIKSKLTVEMYDDPAQSLHQVEALSDWVVSCVEDGPTLVHCQAGLNRSGLVAGRALVKMGRDPYDALDLLRNTRSDAVLCNPAFEDYLLGC
jgi:protein-tyrosine phosphatase